MATAGSEPGTSSPGVARCTDRAPPPPPPPKSLEKKIQSRHKKAVEEGKLLKLKIRNWLASREIAKKKK